jgi:hypothetical protein
MTNKEPFYLRELHLPHQNSFPVSDFLFALARSTISRCAECDKLSSLHRQSVICPRCHVHIERQISYLIRQMMKAYNDKKIRLIDWTLSVWRHGPWETLEDYQLGFRNDYILVPDAECFCELENTKLILEDLVPQTKDQGDIPPNTCEPITNHPDCDVGTAPPQATLHEESPTSETKDQANYRELAAVFHVNGMNEDQRIKWFKQRCSDLKKYPKFSDAVREKGKRGGKPSRFSVEKIAWILLNEKLLSEARLIKGLCTRFPETADFFSERFEVFTKP